MVYRKSLKKNFLISLIFLELVISSQFTIPYTVKGNYSPSFIQNQINHRFAGTPSGYSSNPIKFNSDKSTSLIGLWRNTNIFRKTVSADGFNSFMLKDFERSSSFPKTLDSLLNNPLMYIVKNDSMSLDGVVNESESSKISSRIFLPEISDTLILREIRSHSFVADIICRQKCTIVLLQNFFIGWEAYLDLQKIPITKSNLGHISVDIPEGKHKLSFHYRNNSIKLAAAISAFVFIITLGVYLVMLLISIYKNSANNLLSTVFLLSFLVIIHLAFELTSVKNSIEESNAIYTQYPIKHEHGYDGNLELISPTKQYSQTSAVIQGGDYSNMRKILLRIRGIARGTENNDFFVVAHTHDKLTESISSNYHAIPITSLQVKSSGMNSFDVSIPFYQDNPAMNIIKVYFWNSGKTTEIVSNVRIDIYPL